MLLYLNASGLMWELAPQHNAMLVFAEHRCGGAGGARCHSAALPACSGAYLGRRPALLCFCMFCICLTARSVASTDAALHRGGQRLHAAHTGSCRYYGQSKPFHKPAKLRRRMHWLTSEQVGLRPVLLAGPAPGIRALLRVLAAAGRCGAGRCAQCRPHTPVL